MLPRCIWKTRMQRERERCRERQTDRDTERETKMGRERIKDRSGIEIQLSRLVKGTNANSDIKNMEIEFASTCLDSRVRRVHLGK